MTSTADIFALARVAFLAGVLIAAPMAVAAPAAAAAEVTKAEFGIFDDDGTDQLGFGPTGEIPLSVGQAFGWLIQARTTAKFITVREELLRPEGGAPPEESADTDLTLPLPKATLLGFNERRLPVQDGMVIGMRKVAKEDTPGRYRLKIYVERKLAATFDYALVAPEIVAPPAAPQQTIEEAKPARKPKTRTRRGSSPPRPSR